MKVLAGKAVSEFRYAGQSGAYADKGFVIFKDGARYHGPIDADTKYTLVLFVRDGGDFDIDPTPGNVLDPAVMLRASATGPDSGTPGGAPGSSGGCDAGWGAFGFLALALIAARGRGRGK
jgi:hypothetical protein